MRPSTFVVAILLLCPALQAQPNAIKEVGENDFRISFTLGTGVPGPHVSDPAVAYNSTDHEYLVVWSGLLQLKALICPPEREIMVQRLDAVTGELLGPTRVVSSMGPLCDSSYEASAPAVAYNETMNEYLVVWAGDHDLGGLVNDELEIFGQRLSADGSALGVDDFRISDMGGTGNLNFGAANPAVAYNSVHDEYLVVWSGDDNVGGLVDNELEIFGQRLDSVGTEVGGNDFRISDMGGNGNVDFGAFDPAVVYNSVHDEYLVVWHGDDNVGSLVDNELEIFGQRLDSVGAEVGGNDFRISDMGGDGNVNFVALQPAVAYNSVQDEYLVVWRGDNNVFGLVDNEIEIFGQRLNSLGLEVRMNDFRISDMGGDGNTSFFASEPAVTYNAMQDEYLVIWYGDDSLGGLVDNELEIFGQRLDSTGAEAGVNDFRISDVGGIGDPAFEAVRPAVAYGAVRNEYLVVWLGDDNVGGLVDDEIEIFGQRLAVSLFADGFESGNTSVWSASVP